VRNPEDVRGHPSQALLHAASDVLQVHLIFHRRQPVRTDNSIDLFLGFLLDFGKHHHGLHKAHEGGGCGVGAGFEESSADVSS